jgi:hypothetical protein
MSSLSHSAATTARHDAYAIPRTYNDPNMCLLPSARQRLTDVEIVLPLVGVAPRYTSQWAPHEIRQQDDYLDRDEADQPPSRELQRADEDGPRDKN